MTVGVRGPIQNRWRGRPAGADSRATARLRAC
jgi:hypothetical protein